MSIFRRTVQVGFVWLTAVTTLFANVPRFDCTCPNGLHKPFCLATPAKNSQCCCGGACCPSSSGGSCCCQGSDPAQVTGGSHCRGPSRSAEEDTRQGPRQESTNPSTTEVKVGSSCCKKTFVAGQSVIVRPVESNVRQDLTKGFSVALPPLALASAMPTASRVFFCWQIYDLPPPTDLVIALQRFLI